MSHEIGTIRIEIFEKSLKQLEEEGVDLDRVLNSINCPNYRIQEIQNSEDPPPSSENSDSSEIEVRRCSTPVDPTRKFSLNMREVVSRIDSTQEDRIGDIRRPRISTRKFASSLPMARTVVVPKFRSAIAKIWIEKSRIPEIRENSEFVSFANPIDDVDYPSINFENPENLNEIGDETLQISQTEIRENNGILEISNPRNSTSSEKNEKNREVVEKSDGMRKIQCNFKNCHRQINWKPKYGKMRLVDHALTHFDEKSLKCQKCDFESNTIRKMRYHYGKMHRNEKMSGFGLRRFPGSEKKLRDLLNFCYGNQIENLGHSSDSLFGKKKKNR